MDFFKSKTFIKLYWEYNVLYIHNTVAYGTFPALKPFYVWWVSKKDIAICLCKMHLTMRRTIDILEKLSDKQKIAIDFDDY